MRSRLDAVVNAHECSKNQKVKEVFCRVARGSAGEVPPQPKRVTLRTVAGARYYSRRFYLLKPKVRN